MSMSDIGIQLKIKRRNMNLARTDYQAEREHLGWLNKCESRARKLTAGDQQEKCLTLIRRQKSRCMGRLNKFRANLKHRIECVEETLYAIECRRNMLLNQQAC